MCAQSFETMTMRRDQGFLPEGYVPLEGEYFTREEVLLINGLIEKIENSKLPDIEKIPDGKRMLDQVDKEGHTLDEVEPYPLTIFADQDLPVIPKNPRNTYLMLPPSETYKVLKIKKELLLPGNEDVVTNVEGTHVDLSVWFLNKVEIQQRLRIIAAIQNFEQQTGIVVKHSGNLHK